MLIIDTDVLIDVLRKHPPALKWLAGVTDEIITPGFCSMELVADVHSLAEMRRVDQVLLPVRVVWPSRGAMEDALRIYRSFRLSVAIGFVDAMIAATAIELDLALHTFNSKHYSHVPGLKLIRPYTR